MVDVVETWPGVTGGGGDTNTNSRMSSRTYSLSRSRVLRLKHLVVFQKFALLTVQVVKMNTYCHMLLKYLKFVFQNSYVYKSKLSGFKVSNV